MSTWSWQAYIKASNATAGDWFGFSISLSTDGNTLAVGAEKEDSAATGIGGNQTDDCSTTSSNCATDSGAAYVFTRSGTTWSQQSYVKAPKTGTNDIFGGDICLSGTGDTMAVGAAGEASNATGVGGNETNDAMGLSGATYLY